MEDHTQAQIGSFLAQADRSKPLLICDADEVLLQFFATLERFLDAEGFHVRLESFALHGNVWHNGREEQASDERVSGLLQSFFKRDIHTAPAVTGAPEALEILSANLSICVLTNLPGEQTEARAACLAEAGMAYPVICNSGLKGKAVRMLQDNWQHPVAFIDDLPHNHDSVAQMATDVHRIHYIASPKLSPIIEKPDSAHIRFDHWRDIHAHLESWAAQ
ncbi:MAG: hypothetical protein AAGJ09_03425 [Pseudomonadota bacterium]